MVVVVVIVIVIVMAASYSFCPSCGSSGNAVLILLPLLFWGFVLVFVLLYMLAVLSV